MASLQRLVRQWEPLPDEDVLAALGAALLGSGLGVTPADQSRFRRFAVEWLDKKRESLWVRIRQSETYQLWAATAGPGQVVEPDVVAKILRSEEGEDIAVPLAVAIHRQELEAAVDYDVAVSCAAQQSGYVGRVVSAARALGLLVFYENDMTYEWWGRNFLAEGRRVYGQHAWHFVPFISVDYFGEPRPRVAFETAMMAAAKRGDDYILPVLVGEVTAPPEWLPPHIGVLHAEDNSPEQLAGHLSTKVRATKASGRRSRDFGTAVREAHAAQR